jgi:hypothetical protein
MCSITNTGELCPQVPNKVKTEAEYQWLTCGILDAQEAEIRRIMVQSQPWANSSQNPNSLVL